MFLDQPDGTRIHYEVTGQGPAVAFSHGVLMSGGMWAEQVQRFAPDYTCITWDERGHGQTRTDGSPFDFWDSARDLLAVLSAAGAEQAVLVGHSQGGFLSLRAALLGPGRVNGLVLVPSHAQALDDGTKGAFAQIKAVWLADGPAPAQDALLGLLIGQPALYPEFIRSWPGMDRAAIGSVFDALINLDDIRERLASITAPALVVHGGQDPAMPAGLGRELSERLGHCIGFEVIPGAGHTPSLTTPGTFDALLGGFLRTYAPAAESAHHG